MINKIQIKNFVLYDDVIIDPSKNLTAIVGDSASGKSLLFKALNVFQFNSNYKEEYLKDKNKELEISLWVNISNNEVVKKELLKLNINLNNLSNIHFKTILGKTKKYLINDISLKKKDILNINSNLFNILNQNTNDLIQDSDYIINTIDSLDSKLIKLKEEYIKIYSQYISNKSKEKELNDKKIFLEDEKEYINIKLKKFSFLDDYNIYEVQNLIKRQDELENKLNNLEKYNSLISIFNNQEAPLIEQLYEIKSLSKKIKNEKLETLLSDFIPSLESEIYKIEKTIEDIQSVEDDYNEIFKIQESLNNLKIKYNNNIELIYQEKENLENQIEELDNIGFYINKNQKDIKENESLLKKIDKEMLKTREPIMEKLINNINKDIKLMGMKNASIKYQKSDLKEFTKNGLTNIEILIKTNLSSQFTPINETTSGGETSRLMLSFFKNTNFNNTFLFDEVDTGLSGEIALKMGEVISKLSKKNQVLCITHLVQIACFKNKLYFVSKKDVNSKTISIFEDIPENQYKNYLSKLLIQNENSLRLVDDLLKEAKKRAN